VFVLHGAKLRGGFPGTHDLRLDPQWLLLGRREAQARRHSDIVAGRPESVLSGRRLTEIV